MLTQEQRDNFRLALSAWSNYSAKTVEELDINDIIEDEQIVETRDTIENFFDARGRRLNRNGERPAVPLELNKTICGEVYVWENQQSQKGMRRGTLFVMDFGDARASYFDGEA